jgi:hypothetical protein
MSAPAIESATGLHPVGSQSPGPFQEQSAKNKEPKAPRRPNLKPETFNLKQQSSPSPSPPVSVQGERHIPDLHRPGFGGSRGLFSLPPDAYRRQLLHHLSEA